MKRSSLFPLSSVLFCLIVFAGQSSARYIDSTPLKLSTLKYEVSGIVQIVDDTTIRIKDFNYNGKGPDAFFAFSTISSKPGSKDAVPIVFPATKSHEAVPFTAGSDKLPVLKAYEKETIELKLPQGYKTDDLKWLSVYCRKFAVDFGNVIFSGEEEISELITDSSPLKLSTLEYEVSGNVELVDDSTIRITDFNYNGEGPDAFFAFSTISSKPGSKDAVPIVYPAGKSNEPVPFTAGSDKLPILKAYKKETIELKLPTGYKTGEIKWLSVFCRKYEVDFGNVIFSTSMKLSTLKYEVSGTVKIVDDTTIRITGFNYNGEGPDAFFAFSTVSSKPGSDDAVPIVYPATESNEPVPFTAGSDKLPILKAFDKETIELKLPLGYKTGDLKWLSVYCRKFEVDFGNVIFSAPMKLSTLEYEVSGTVEIVDDTTIRIRDFNYNGEGPDAFFAFSTISSRPGSKDAVPIVYPTSKSNELVPFTAGSDKLPILKAYEKETIILKLPRGYKTSDLKWLSVYCRKYEVDFGNVIFADSTPLKLSTLHHNLSGTVEILDDTTIRIKDFIYDGEGPDAFFVFSTKSSKPGPKGAVPIVYPASNSNEPIPFSAGTDKLPILKKFDKETIELKLPNGYKTSDLKWLSVYCRQYDVDFGNVIFPAAPMKLITFKHGVSGTVKLLDKSTIQIVDFSYDGKIHDAYFFFSTKSSKPGRADIVPIVYPSKVSKKPVPYNAGPDKLPILKRFKKETIELKLPLGYSTDELKWLSVYCRGYDVEFGTLVFPN